MKVPKIFLVVLLLSIITSCQNKGFESIPNNQDFLISFNLKESSISFIDVETYSEAVKWEFDQPFSGALLLPNNHILFYGRHLEDLYIYNLSSGKLIDKWPSGKGVANALLSSDENYIFLANQQKNAIQVIDTNGSFQEVIPVENGPLTLVEDTHKNRLYVIHFDSPVISTIDLDQLKTIGSFTSNKRAVGATLANNNQELWVGGHGAGKNIQREIIVYQLPQGDVVSAIKAGTMPVDLKVKGDYVYALSHGTNTLSKINMQTYETTQEITVGSNSFVMNFFQEDLYIASYDSNEIFIINPDDLKVITSFESGNGPFDLLYRKEVN